MLTKLNNVILDITISQHLWCSISLVLFKVSTSLAADRGSLVFGQTLILSTTPFPSQCTVRLEDILSGIIFCVIFGGARYGKALETKGPHK